MGEGGLCTGQRSCATEVAIVKATCRFKAHSHMWRIKRSSGWIEDWVRHLICRLVTVHHLPALHAPGAVVDIVWAIITKLGKILYKLTTLMTRSLPRYGVVTDYNSLSVSGVAIVIVISVTEKYDI